jgi:hypothetical protein
VPDDLLVVLGTSHIEAHHLHAVDALRSELIGGSTPPGLVAAADHDREAELTQAEGGLQPDSLVRSRNECHFP